MGGGGSIKDGSLMCMLIKSVTDELAKSAIFMCDDDTITQVSNT